MQPVFDRSLQLRRRRRAGAEGGGATFLVEAAAADILARLALVNRRFGLAIDLGTPTAHLADGLVASGQVERVVRIDRFARPGATLVGDEELLPIRAAGADLVVSALALQDVNDLPGTLVQIRHALRPDGLFLAALLGDDTLGELARSLAEAEAELTGGASPRVGPFAELAALGPLLQRAGFALPVSDRDRLAVRYGSMFSLLRDLRGMGATSTLLERSRRPLRRAVLLRAAELYAKRFADPDGRIRASFVILSMSGWAPSESQPRPLRPGSAKSRLADALGAREQNAGERAG